MAFNPVSNKNNVISKKRRVRNLFTITSVHVSPQNSIKAAWKYSFFFFLGVAQKFQKLKKAEIL